MIYGITDYYAKCDRCEKKFSPMPYPTKRSLNLALLVSEWDVDDDHEYIHCPDCIEKINKPKDSKPLRGGFAEEP